MKDLLDDHLFSKNEEDFQSYRTFLNVEEAKSFCNLLTQKEIGFKLESSGTVIDSAIVGDGLVPKAIVKIRAADFKRVNAIIAADIQALSYEDLGDHYLTQLDDEELMEIFRKPEEWSMEDTGVAKIILAHRGLALSEEQVGTLRAERLSEIRAGKEGSAGWMAFYLFGMILGLFVSLLLLIAGVAMSYYYAYGTSTDPDGNKHFVYEPKTRQFGVYMFYGGLAFMILEVLLFFFWG